MEQSFSTWRVVSVVFGALVASSALVAAGCSGNDGLSAADRGTAAATTSPRATSPRATETASPATTVASSPVTALPPAPGVPAGELRPAAVGAVDALVADAAAAIVRGDELDLGLVRAVGATGDARVGWVITDLLRFFQKGPERDALLDATEQLTGVRFAPDKPWVRVSDAMIAWDIPAPAGYQNWKATVLSAIEPLWEPALVDEAAVVDWRLVGWGGVLLDNRFVGDVEGCAGCIASMDFPPSITADQAWLEDDDIVFGVVIDGEARAYPRNIMEVHELANDKLGGRNFALAYCTLCGSAEAYFTDVAPGTPDGPLILRTSGLLQRSNKLMWEFRTGSMIDTFTGRALTGPMLRQGVTMSGISVVTARWADWLAEHPDSTLNDGAGGGGAGYPDNPLRDRDVNGPTFPVGQVDDRLGPQVEVVGAIGDDGPVAFPVATAKAVLDRGEPVESGGLRVTGSSGGLVIVDAAGVEIPTSESRWFAWSQFNPDTVLWSAP